MQLEEIAGSFGCKIKFCKPLRAVYLAGTDQGTVIIKEVKRDPDKILYIHWLKEHLYNNGFTSLDRYRLTETLMPFVIKDDRIFVVEDYISGRECSFTNPFDRERAAMVLADLHNKGKGYIPPIGAAARSNYGKWKKDYLRKVDYLLNMERGIKAKRKKEHFDKLFLKGAAIAVHMCWKAYDTLRQSAYEQEWRRAEAQKAVCHHDYTYHNILMTEDGGVNVIDFDYSCHELPVYDLANYILRIMKRFEYDVDIALSLIEAYNRVRPVSRDELQLMLSIFEFPQRFWRIVDRHYEGKTEWSRHVFIDKLEDAFEETKLLLPFADSIRSLI